jgi:hypothetical protein
MGTRELTTVSATIPCVYIKTIFYFSEQSWIITYGTQALNVVQVLLIAFAHREL